MQLISQLSEEKAVTNEDMLLLCNLPGSAKSPHVLYSYLRQHLLGMRHLPVVKLLVTKEKEDLNTLFQELEAQDTAEVSTSVPENCLAFLQFACCVILLPDNMQLDAMLLIFVQFLIYLCPDLSATLAHNVKRMLMVYKIHFPE